MLSTDGPDGNFDLGVLDGCFLFAYALTMFISGHFGDRVNLTYLLTIGMLGMYTTVSYKSRQIVWSHDQQC